jgi:beta-xylosidase
LDSLSDWTRNPDNPIYRDRIPGYEVASDGHVFHDSSGALWMIYTGDSDDHASIKLATADAYDVWTEEALLLPGDQKPSGDESGKETAYYNFVESTEKHQIYYVGYADGNPDIAYEAESLHGPYSLPTTPIVSNGALAGEDVHLMTSPSVVEYQGDLYLTFIAWDAPPNLASMVWMMGSVSSDGGNTWSMVEKINAPIGMEGQITKGPDGLYYAVSTQDYQQTEAIFLARSVHPFGPYDEALPSPLLVKAGTPWEVDEVIAPQLTFNPVSKRAYLYYTGANHATGWWMMVAHTSYTVE